ncbi:MULTISPECIES: CDP-alcohol phosphatidyltransferase family protein [unclassified Nocardioides]|uniref:CDP-alcohol phosphatidyltransferase family protein n=1 Tax=unclassified Nocardioides TaxID=2615069 RepID=UPI001F6174E7|nr:MULTISPECIES: CDP-alcohol phosphatidyltransferase family protein [unclassified Nocardioides]
MHRVHRPADAITLVRAVLAVVVAAIGPTGPGLALVVVALCLDWVDGQVARRTHTESAFGARFDMETDAFLIAVLSVYVAADLGWWVLLIGAARYLLWLAERVLPWLRRPVPPRYWRKVVAAVQGIVLAVAASGLVPDAVAQAMLLVALGLLAESFGRDVWWLWHTRRATAPYPTGGGATLVAIAAVWLALVLPQTPGDLLRVPVEAVLLVVVALLPWRPARRLAAAVIGVALAVVVVLTVLDVGFERVLDRPFDPVADWVYLADGVGVLGDSIGVAAARATAVAALVLVVAVLVLLPLAAVRVSGTVATHPRAAVSVALALLLAPITQLGSTSAAVLAYDEVVQVRADLADRRTFGREIAADRYAGVPADRLLRGLRGKDVLVVFVESYGRVAVQGTSYSPGIAAVLDDGSHRLRAAGYASRSAFLTSPTFGAGSWLAHASVQSGLWVDSEQRYEQLLGQDRLTLTSAFGAAGWRTVFDVPADTRDWPEGADFYGFDHLYDSRNVGYRGPEFGYAPMPDQYTLKTFQHLELDPADRPPVMGEIDLVSSHHPWAPSPELVPWDQVGDGSVFADVPTQPDSSDVQTLYGQSVEYTMGTLVSWLETQPDPDLVLLVLGDHQPHSYVSGPDPGHDVPVSLIARDRGVVRRIADWGWQPGLHPSPDAPVWPMNVVRDRFLAAFSR